MPTARGHRVVVVTTLPPDRGNLAEYGSYICSSLARNPKVEDVTVLANRVESAPEHELVEGYTVQRSWKLGSVLSVFGIAISAMRLKPDVVYINAGIRTWGVGRAVSLAGALLPSLLRVLGLPVVTTLHTIGETVKLDTLNLGFFTRMGMKLANWLYLRSNWVTVTLGSMKKTLEDRFGAKNVAHVAHGTYGPRIPAPLVPEKIRVLSFGFWGAFKDADLLVESVRQLRKDGVDAELVLGGGAHPYFPEIYHELVARYQRESFVRFTGYVPEAKLTELFTSASVVVLPYRTNAGASGVLNLCRSYGRPVVVSNEPCLLEQLSHEGGAAKVFESPGQLATVLHDIVTSHEVQHQMGAANLEVARNVTIDSQMNEVVGLFGRLRTSRSTVANSAPAES